ncbi:MAG: hypothetical protein PVI57_22970 [Gemmatimonadota bacterium]|jgi:hypothetical protein
MRNPRPSSALPVASPLPLASLSLRPHSPPGDEDVRAPFRPYRPEGVARVEAIAPGADPCELLPDRSVWLRLGGIVR